MALPSILSILQGNVGRVIRGLKQTLKKRRLSKSKHKAIEKVIRYFENHRQWMHYDEYSDAGFPIGSGVVESTCGHTVKDRMKGTSRRWSIEGAESTFLLRSVVTVHPPLVPTLRRGNLIQAKAALIGSPYKTVQVE